MEDPKIIAERMIHNVEQVIIGKEAEVRMALIALLCQGHVLIEDVPGVGKTILARSIAVSAGCNFRRIQFTPDLLPSDVSGVSIYSQKTGDFEFRPGPIMAQVVLADEINRATPKTQSALLEAMQERQVTVGGKTYKLDDIFFVLATQNPLEMEGTYPLPEAQLDRFIYKLIIDFPTRTDLIEVLRRTTDEETRHAEKILRPEELLEMRRLVREVIIAPHVEELAADLLLRTHPANPDAPAMVKKYVRFGASPRGAQAIVLTAKARALLSARYNVSTGDILAVARPSLRHRMILNFEGEADGISTDAVLDEVLDSAARLQKTGRASESEGSKA